MGLATVFYGPIACVGHFNQPKYEEGYVRSTRAVVRTMDRDMDGLSETVLQYTTQDGETVNIDLTTEALDGMVRTQYYGGQK